MKNALEKEITETQAKQIELDKTAEEFRQLHRERQDLVRQWQEAIEAMKRRDTEIERAGEKFAAAKRDLQLQQEILEDTKSECEKHGPVRPEPSGCPPPARLTAPRASQCSS